MGDIGFPGNPSPSGPYGFPDLSPHPEQQRPPQPDSDSRGRFSGKDPLPDPEGSPKPVPSPPGPTEGSVTLTVEGDALTVEKDGYRVVSGNIDVREAALDALGETLAEPVTNVLIMGVRLSEGDGEDALTAEEVDKICGVAKIVVDPSKFVSSVINKVVEHFATHLLAAPLGPVGVGIAVFAGNFAGDLSEQVLDPSKGEGVRDAEHAMEVADMLVDNSIGRLAESDQFREFISELLSKPIIAILDGDIPAAPDQTPDQMTSQPATISVLIATYKVDRPTAGHMADQRFNELKKLLDEAQDKLKRAEQDASFEIVAVLTHRDIPSLERELAEAKSAITSFGHSAAVHVRPGSFALACIPQDAVAGQWRWITHKSGTFEQGKFLLLTDGTLVERHIHEGRPGPWTRVSDWPVTTDLQEAEAVLQRREYELIPQSKLASTTATTAATQTRVDGDLLAAYQSLKKWAIRNGVQ